MIALYQNTAREGGGVGRIADREGLKNAGRIAQVLEPWIGGEVFDGALDGAQEADWI